MSLLNPLGLLLLGLAIPVILLHILRPRRVEEVVSSTFLWQRMEKPVTATAPWQRLRPSWLLLMQLLAVVLLALLVANPARVTEAPLAQHTVFLIDGSGSMQALDGGEGLQDRLSAAQDRAIDVRAQLPDGGLASVIEVGPTPRVLLTTSSDEDDFAEAVNQVRSTNGTADFASAFALAEGLETPGAPVGFVLVSDGGLTQEELRLVPSGLTYEPVGTMATNRAITDLRVETRADGLFARVTVDHTGGPTATQTVRVDVDGRTRFTEEITLERNDRRVLEIELPPGDRVEAFLEGEDLLDIDDRRWAVTSRRSALEVLVVGKGDPFLMAMLEAVDGVTVSASETLPEVWDADLVVFDQIAVPEDPGAPFLAIAPPGGFGDIAVTGVVELPPITLVRTEDPLLRDLDLSGVGIAQAQRITTIGVDTLVAAESAPLMVRGRHAGRPFVYLSFAMSASNLPVQVAYPILGDRLVAELGGSALPPTDLVVGRQIRLSGDTATITDPGGRTIEVGPGDLAPVAERPGWWTIEIPDGPTQVVAVNPDTAESTLAPVPAIPSEVRTIRPGEDPPQNQRSWRPWLALGLLAVLAIEWLLSRRQVGVGRRQWRLAQLLRLAIAAALIGVFFNVGFDRAENQVATVFVIDASDSLGDSGRNDAVVWVREALLGQPEDAVAGVVLFGGDARIEALVQSELSLARPAVRIDPSRTDLAAAIRLGAAVLPADAKRRLVLISDGRATTGDVQSEAARLGADGVAVDVHVVGGSVGNDVAVNTVDVPGFVREGEAIPIEAEITAGAATPATVTLLRDGDVIDASTVELAEGSNQLTFVDRDPLPGLHRYEVQVNAGDDAVAQNDRGFGSVQVGTASGVLVVEGVPGNAEAIAAALEAGGTRTEVVSTTAINSVEDLVAWDAIVLVDVAAWDLAPAQIQAITTAVRDTGRGLVTIGGQQSYGIGGYLGSELEDVLPIVSDILDPKRRQTVAEVLAIDTSGSMGACHCADGQESMGRQLGGVTKTDIAAAGAARTIAALSETDEVGVLAFDTQARWVVDLQSLPSQEVVAEGLGSLFPNGGTNLNSTLETAAIELRASDASLKHIILFSDGFTSMGGLEAVADEARALLENDGITTSVIATGEGAADDLRPIAEAGGGRFYPGRDLDRIPQIILEEALQASRDFINEGEFFPEVVSNDDAIRGLSSSPPLLGYIASSTKPTAQTLLRIGPDQDPLLASWQVGLGTATAWTSDASQRWSQQWATWDGYVQFWNQVVRDTFPSASGDVETRTRVVGDLLRIEVDSVEAFADGSQAVARVTDPTGETQEVPLDRVGPNTWAAEVPVEAEGVYAVGTAVSTPDGSSINGTALASRAYSFEYRPGSPDVELMERIALLTDGRADVTPEQAFDEAELQSGTSRFSLVPWLLLASALLWPLAVLLSRIAWRRDGNWVVDPTAADTNAALKVRRAARTSEDTATGDQGADDVSLVSVASEPSRGDNASVGEGPVLGGVRFPAAPPATAAEPPAPFVPPKPIEKVDSGEGDGAPASTLDALLARKRQQRDTDGDA